MNDNKNEYKTPSQLAILERLKNGLICGAIPMGYIKKYDVNTGKMKIEVDAEKSKLVKLAFELYATQSYSLETLGFKLYELCGTSIPRTTLSTLFRNPFYIGLMLIKGKVYPHIYPTFIDRNLFNKVEEVLNKGRNIRGIGKRNNHINRFLFKALIRCKVCAGTIVCERTKDRYTYYHCQGRKIMHDDRIYLREEYLLSQMQEIIQQIDIEIWNYFESIEFVDKRSLLRYLFKKIELECNQLSVEKNDYDLSLNAIKSFINKTIILNNTLISSGLIDQLLIDTNDYKNIYLNLCKQPKSLEQIIQLTQLDLNEIQTNLLDLQLDGKIDQNNEGLWKTI